LAPKAVVFSVGAAVGVGICLILYASFGEKQGLVSTSTETGPSLQDSGGEGLGQTPPTPDPQGKWACFWPGSPSEMFIDVEGSPVLESELSGSLFAGLLELRRKKYAGLDDLAGQFLRQKEKRNVSEVGLSETDLEQLKGIEDEAQREAALRLLRQVRENEESSVLGLQLLQKHRDQDTVGAPPGYYCGPRLPSQYAKLRLPRFGSFSNQMSLGLAVNWECPSCRQTLLAALEMISSLPFAVEVRVLGVTLFGDSKEENRVARAFHCGFKEMPTKAANYLEALARSAVRDREGTSLELYYRQFPEKRSELETCEKEFIEKLLPELSAEQEWLLKFTSGEQMGWENQVVFILNGRVIATHELENIRWLLTEVVNEL
jgi:hypothetical protein